MPDIGRHIGRRRGLAGARDVRRVRRPDSPSTVTGTSSTVHLLQPSEADQRWGVRGEVHRSRGDVRPDRAREAGDPSGLFTAGLFQDKINLTWTRPTASSPASTAWSRHHGLQSSNAVLFARSTDQGLSFSRPFKVTPNEHGTASFADLAVGPDGTVYLTYLTYPSSSRPTADVWLLVSTDGGVSFGADPRRHRSSCSTRTSSPVRPERWTAATDRSPARAGSRSRGSSATRRSPATTTASTSCGLERGRAVPGLRLERRADRRERGRRPVVADNRPATSGSRTSPRMARR